MKQDDLRLQALRIPTGWIVSQNKFFAIDPPSPGEPLSIEGFPENNGWMLFEQDLLQLEHKRRNRILDLGWVPYWDPEGRYVLTLIQGTNWETPIIEFESRSKDEIVNYIEKCLARVSRGEL